jgi:putative membrane protein
MTARIVAYIVGSIVAVLSVGEIFQSSLVTYRSEEAVILFGAILGILIALVKPVLQAISVPISCITFGLFALVINAFLFWLAARLTPDMSVTIWGALVGGIFASVINGVVFSVVDEK